MLIPDVWIETQQEGLSRLLASPTGYGKNVTVREVMSDIVMVDDYIGAMLVSLGRYIQRNPYVERVAEGSAKEINEAIGNVKRRTATFFENTDGLGKGVAGAVDRYLRGRYARKFVTVGDLFTFASPNVWESGYSFSERGVFEDWVREEMAEAGLSEDSSPAELLRLYKKIGFARRARKLFKAEEVHRGLGYKVRELFRVLRNLVDPEYAFAEQTKDAVREVQLGKAKLIIVDPAREGSSDKKVLGVFQKAKAMIERAGLSKAWYGNMFYMSKESGKLTQSQIMAMEKMGYAGIRGFSGVYKPNKDVVEVWTWPDSALGTLIHELGHRYFFKILSSEQRARFNSLIAIDPKLDEDEEKERKPRDFPPSLVDERGEPKVVPVSSYGKANIDEAFAEVFKHYVLGIDMSGDQRESFRSVLKKLSHRVAFRHMVRAHLLSSYSPRGA
jgi:hypothetical protein